MDGYKEYLKKWIANNGNGRESPLSRSQWEQVVYFAGAVTETEWVELRDIYNHLTDISKDIEATRVKLYSNRAHRDLNSDDWEHLDRVLFRIQSEIWSDSNDGFGSAELAELC